MKRLRSLLRSGSPILGPIMAEKKALKELWQLLQNELLSKLLEYANNVLDCDITKEGSPAQKLFFTSQSIIN